jgi:MoaA/NifB/PqqE/SkfB family radical SAM enzyme
VPEPEGRAPAAGARQRIVQVHPTLRCNLTCHHCYSSSGPDRREDLDPDVLCRALEDAAELGYEVVSFSGGEPFMYRALDRVLAHARTVGLRTTVTTNGSLLGAERLASVRPDLDAIAVSFDGPPDLHNRIRGAEWAFERAVEGVEQIRDAGIPFGLIYTVTRDSWEHLVWVGRFAVDQGARLLQLHPLELTGRAATDLAGEGPDQVVFARAYLMAAALGVEHAGRLAIQLDLFLADEVRAHPDLVYGDEVDERTLEGPAADLMGVLVIEPDGSVVPVSYGFGRPYRVGNLYQAGLADAWRAYVATGGYARFRALCRGVWRELVAGDRQLVNWHELIVERSLDPVTVPAAVS